MNYHYQMIIRNGSKILRCIAICFIALSLQIKAEDKIVVCSLHPLITEMIQKISGDYFQVEELMGPSQSPHSFDPKPKDLLRLQNAELVVAMGKGLETYLDRIWDNLKEGASVYELGEKIPSLLVSDENPVFICCPTHSQGAIDPHWWHNPQNMRRAVRYLNIVLTKLAPDDKAAEFKANSKSYMEELNELDEWTKTGLKLIPSKYRKLVTAHAAFAYFCDAYNFKSIAVQGLTKEQSPSPSYLKETINTIRKHKIRAIFAEHDANPKIMEAIKYDTGVRMGDTLLADNMGHKRVTYRQMIESNVRSIITALAIPVGEEE